MKLFLSVCMAAMMALSAKAQGDMTLWYNTPAHNWNDALPLGNGRIASMVYGNPIGEEFQLNEETISKGSPYNNYNPETPEYLQTIRQMIFEGRNDEAQKLAETKMLAPKSKGFGAAYQTAGSLNVRFTDHEGYKDLRRELKIDSALSVVTYTVGDVKFKEEAFTSFTDQLLIIRYTASKGKSLNFDASLSYPEGGSPTYAIDGQTLIMTGTTDKAADDVPGKVRYLVNAKVVNKGGRATRNGNTLAVRDADEVTIYVAMATNFVNYRDISANPKQRIKAYMKNCSRPYAEAKQAHVAKFKEQFDRMSLNLGKNNYAKKTTEERIRDFAGSDDKQLVALYFQFGRYLLICSSQPGCQPANLQGKWNAKLNPSWRCRYTININTEMNYWPAEPCNLSELHEPLVKMIGELSQAGAETARKMYGCRGWVTHHNTDLWRMTGAVDRAYCGVWPTSNAWLCQHLWNRYLYNGDKQYLASVYKYMKGAAEFFVDFMVKDPRSGYLVVCPSNSPENGPKLKVKSNLYAGVTMDNELVANLLTTTAAAAEILGVDRSFADTLMAMRSQLIPLRIGRTGQLQEWADDWDNPNDHHRHVSHLWALYPGTEVSPYRTPEAFKAVRTSMIQRGDQSTGWSMGWKVCLWARLLNGEHAYKLIKDQLTLVPNNMERGQGGGTYPNMFDAHPPFQIDGNFGCTAGIGEMMVQSHDGAVHLLPALPIEWSEGEVKGMRTVGGFVVENLKWSSGRIEKVTIRSTIGGNLRLRTATALKSDKGTLASAKGENPNPLFATWTMPVTKTSAQGYTPVTENACLAMPGEHLYDIDTKAGDVITLTME